MTDFSPVSAPEEPRELSTDEKVENEKINLSPYTEALFDSLKDIKPRATPDDLSKLSVSQAVSLMAIAYEKVRNAIEYREDHLVLRAAIERNLKRRLALNPQGTGEAENLLRELMWARYFPNESLGDHDIQKVQEIIDKYLFVKNLLLTGKDGKTQVYLFQHLFEFLTCEIEESLNPGSSQKISTYTYFIFQILKDKIKVEGLDEDKKNAFLLIALDKAYRKSDSPYLRYHLFTTFYQPIATLHQNELEKISSDLPTIFKNIDETLTAPYVDSLTKFVRKQLPPFLILFDIINERRHQAKSIISEKNGLWLEVERMCNEKYKQVGSRLRNLAFRSLIYIFVTKMLLALILEYPVSQFLYGEANTASIAINTIFPPILMLIIVLFFKLPGEENTRNIFKRIIDIIDEDQTFETQVSYMKKKRSSKKPFLIFTFTVIYSLTFLLTFYLLNIVLSMLNFNLISKIIFVFFISVISFFSFRIKQVSSEYKLKEKEGALTPLVDFFFIPILSLGKFFSKELSRLNVFIIFFDFIIEAPFKLVIEIFEEWIKFVRSRKEEIV